MYPWSTSYWNRLAMTHFVIEKMRKRLYGYMDRGSNFPKTFVVVSITTSPYLYNAISAKGCITSRYTTQALNKDDIHASIFKRNSTLLIKEKDQCNCDIHPLYWKTLDIFLCENKSSVALSINLKLVIMSH